MIALEVSLSRFREILAQWSELPKGKVTLLDVSEGVAELDIYPPVISYLLPFSRIKVPLSDSITMNMEEFSRIIMGR